tara:strand:+ start:7074 stop:7535 length:462 start_codon:yes stop_codon:yes gene_type:complete
MKYKCPACGYQPDKQLAMKQTIEIYKNFSKEIQKDLKKIIQDVNRILFANQMPVEKKYRFLYSISPCNEEDIEYGIRTWNLKKMATSGKSLEYLSAIIRGRGETKEATKVIEKYTYGSNPPDIQQKEVEKNESSKLHKKLQEGITIGRRKSHI